MKPRNPMPRLARPGALASILMLLAAWAAGPAAAVDYGSPAPTTTSAPARLQLGAGSSAALGSFLVGPNGMTLYTLSSDPNNGSVCAGGCLANWPPLLIAPGGSTSGPAGATGTFGAFVRSDGTAQVTHDSRPLYYFAHDTAPGQTNGEGIAALGGVWHVASAVLAVAASSPSATASATSAATVPPTSTGGSRSGDGPGGIPALLLALLGAGAATIVAVGSLSRRMRRA